MAIRPRVADRRRPWPRWGGAAVASLAAHALGLVLISWTAPRQVPQPAPAPEVPRAEALSVSILSPPPAPALVEIFVPSEPAGHLPPAPLPVPAPLPMRAVARAEPMGSPRDPAAPVAESAPLDSPHPAGPPSSGAESVLPGNPVDPDPAPPLATVEVAAPGPPVVAPGAGPSASGTRGSEAGALAAPGGGGSGSGPGMRRRRRTLELFGRVVGGSACAVPDHADRPCVSLREATGLRARDHFPRLPAAQWPEIRPYVVRVELCVSVEGVVSDAVLLSDQSPRLDPIVLEAVRTWRYNPRLTNGQPAPFCHGVVIQYDAF